MGWRGEWVWEWEEVVEEWHCRYGLLFICAHKQHLGLYGIRICFHSFDIRTCLLISRNNVILKNSSLDS